MLRRRRLGIPGTGLVEQRREVTRVRLPLVSFRGTCTLRAGGAVITSDSALRFGSGQELDQSLAAQGYRVRDVREAPDRLGRELVFIAKRTT
jgi:hypothetical protein